MKKFLLITFSFVMPCILYCQLPHTDLLPKIDERMELLSIAFRLASHDLSSKNTIYTNAIDQHFSAYANHPLIKYLRTTMDSLAKDSINISDWELPSLAVHVGPPPNFDPLVPLDEKAPDGWDDRTLLNTRMLQLLRQFYADAQCMDFFKSQNAYYEKIKEISERQLVKIDQSWFKDFFAVRPTENYFPILSLLGYGDWDYIRVNLEGNRRNTHTILACTSFDEHSMPTNLNAQAIGRMALHEHIHAFTNQLIDKNIDVLRGSAEILLDNPKVWNLVKGTFYNNWQFLLYESMVRACSIKYIAAHPEFSSTLEKEIATQEKAGFLWMKDLIELLDYYDKNRKQGKAFNDFMPNIVALFNRVAHDIKNR